MDSETIAIIAFGVYFGLCASPLTIATRKGYSAPLFFAMGFVFTPIVSFLILLVLRPIKRSIGHMQQSAKKHGAKKPSVSLTPLARLVLSTIQECQVAPGGQLCGVSQTELPQVNTLLSDDKQVSKTLEFLESNELIQKFPPDSDTYIVSENGLLVL